MAARKRKEYGQYVVADPEIYDGELIFKGTRIKVESVLRMVERGTHWDKIIRRYNGRLTRDAIMEAIQVTTPVPANIPRPKGKRIELGQYIVADPEICHGQLTFKGTRIFVKDVLDMIAEGWDWQRISEAWDGRVSHEAIAEAVELARKALVSKMEKRRRANLLAGER
jgi:uncharacterized protein (DUF433 family)